MIGQGHGKGYVLEFDLYLGYPWNNFTNILTTMMASRPTIKSVWSSDLGNVVEGHHLQKSLYLSQSLPNFYEHYNTVANNKHVIWAVTENVGQKANLQE